VNIKSATASQDLKDVTDLAKQCSKKKACLAAGIEYQIKA